MRNRQLLRVAREDLEDLALQLRHRLTMLCDRRQFREGRPTGISVWSTEGRSATVYWPWVITEEGYPALADTKALRSNLLFLRDGQPGDYDDQFTGINVLVCGLPWQQEVRDYLARLGEPLSRPAAGRRPGNRGRVLPMPQKPAMVAVADHAIAA